MRDKIIDAIKSSNKKFFFLTGDLGFKTFDPLKNKLDKYFINVGVAEQNMINIATGLSKSNLPILVYSIVNFMTFRCLEQIRNNIAYQKRNIKIISNGAGFAYNTLGFTHHGVEDLAVINSLPNIEILTPTFESQIKRVTKILLYKNGPVYLRLDNRFIKKENTISHNINKKTKKVIISYGSILKNIYMVVNKLKIKEQISVITPLNFKDLKKYKKKLNSRRIKKIIIIEEHNETCGLAIRYKEYLSEEIDCKIKIKGIRLSNPHKIGDREFLLNKNGLGYKDIYNSIMK